MARDPFVRQTPLKLKHTEGFIAEQAFRTKRSTITMLRLWFQGCNTVQSCRQIPTFRSSILPPSSEINCIRRIIGWVIWQAASTHSDPGREGNTGPCSTFLRNVGICLQTTTSTFLKTSKCITRTIQAFSSSFSRGEVQSVHSQFDLENN
jgi:hypothetical protein